MFLRDRDIGKRQSEAPIAKPITTTVVKTSDHIHIHLR